MRILRYPGGKSRVSDMLLGMMPKRYSEFREPFAGGGVFPAVTSRVRKWVNDADPNLMEFYFALRDDPAGFIARCREIAPASAREPTVPLARAGKHRVNA